MKALMSISFILSIGTAIMNEFNPFSLVLMGVTGIGAVYQFIDKQA